MVRPVRVMDSHRALRTESTFASRRRIQFFNFQIISAVRSQLWQARKGLTSSAFCTLLLLSVGLSGCGYFSPNQVKGAVLTLPASLAFGTVQVGQKATLQVGVQNSGNVPVTIYQVSISGQSFAVTGAGSLPLTLAAGSSLNLAVEFNPSTSGSLTGALTITSNATANTTATVTLSGTGGTATSTTATLSVNPSSVAFGNVGVNSSGAATVTLSSTGTAPVTVSSASVSGAEFTLSSASLPATLNPGQTLALQLQFSPTATGSASGQLTVVSNSSTNPTAQIALTGAGVSSTSLPVLTVNPASVSFGSVAVNSTSTQSISLTSSGSAALTINSLTVSGAGFTLAPVTMPATLNSGQTLTVGIQFNPGAAGNFTGQLVIASNSSTGATVNVGLTGTGTASNTVATLTVSPSSLAFGNVTVSSSASQTITLTSTGTGPVTISSLTMSGAEFSVSGLAVPATLNPGQSASLTVQFSPTAAGAVSGQLTVASNSSTNPSAVIALTGSGTQHIVDLNWSAPATSSDPATGYHVYRSISGANAYQFLGTVGISLTTYTDLTAQSATTYDYVVKSVDAQGVESVPSNLTTAVIP